MPGEKKTVSSAVNVNGNLTLEKNVIAAAFNHYFVETVKRLRESVSFGTTYVLEMIFRPVNEQIEQFHFEEISERFVYKQLCKLKSGKAVGMDQIPTRLMKDCAEVISKPLTKLINMSLSLGQVPSDRKVARVIPFFKGERLKIWTTIDQYQFFLQLPSY